MIIRHDVDPYLYVIDPEEFPAIVAIDSVSEEVLVAYDNIDRLLKPSLIADCEAKLARRDRCDAMGSLIHPDWIVTAAHVATKLALTKKIKFNNSFYDIQQVVLHPLFCNDDLDINVTRIQNDIALIQLTQSVLDVLPLKLYRHTDELNQIVTLIGKGDYGNGLIGPDRVDEKTRLATNHIEKVDDQWLMFKFDAPPETTDLEGMSGPGDSGGPALVKTETGWAIAGISASQDAGRLGAGCYGTWDYYTRLSSYLNWIESVIG
jgi:hypothetical protein